MAVAILTGAVAPEAHRRRHRGHIQKVAVVAVAEVMQAAAAHLRLAQRILVYKNSCKRKIEGEV